MRPFALVLAPLVLAGCGGHAVPVVEAASAPTVDPEPPICTFDLVAPEPLQGELAHPETGLDCVPPEGGPDFKVGFAYDAWRFVVTIPRDRNRVGNAIPLDGSGLAHLLYLGPAGSCVDWTGEVVWVSDLPAWSIYVDATCADDPGLRIIGQWGAQAH